MPSRKLLFRSKLLNEELGKRWEAVERDIDAVDEERFLNTPLESLSDYVEKKYRIEPLLIHVDEQTLGHQEADIEVRRDFRRDIPDREDPFLVKGTRFTFRVPFSGDPFLLDCRPSTHNLSPPAAEVVGSELRFVYDDTSQDVESVRRSYDSDLGEAIRYTRWVHAQVQDFNTSLGGRARQHITARRDRLLKARQMAEALGVPLRPRENAPTTFAVPVVRRKLVPQLPPASSGLFKPEPSLDLAQYEQILQTIQNMALVLERNPSAFAQAKEETLRTHFLVQLNAQYEGQATGETFNFEGKTDILVHSEGRNVFIAECKFWSGPKGLSEAVDQLLGYTSWRDTKTAILLFNRQKDFTQVLAKVPETIKVHPNFRRQLPYHSETGFRFALHHRDDSARELILSVLAFEVPQ